MKRPSFEVMLENPADNPEVLPLSQVGFGTIGCIIDAQYVDDINQQFNGSNIGWFMIGPELILPIGVAESALAMDSLELYDERTQVRLLMPEERLVIKQTFTEE